MNGLDWLMHSRAGFYGKIPSTGDFISRRLSQPVIFIWDNWLRHCLYETKTLAASAQSQDRRHCTNIWNFVVPPTICAEPLIGMIAPSYDRVGRQFPFTLFKSITTTLTDTRQLAQIGDFFSTHQPIIRALFQRHLSISQLEQLLADVGNDALAHRLPDTPPIEIPRPTGDVLAVFNDPIEAETLPQSRPFMDTHNRQVPWPMLRLSEVMAGTTSYWWSTQSDCGPVRRYTHTGGLNQTLFTTLFSSVIC